MAAKPPLDLLREIRAAYQLEATELRRQAAATDHPSDAGSPLMRARAAQTLVQKIDETLRDWG